MLKQFILDLKLYKNRFLAPLLCLPGGFAFGFLLHAIILFADKTVETWGCLGTIMTLGALLISGLLIYALYYHQELMLALSMGRTRREFTWAYALRQLVWMVVGYVIVLMLYRLELALGSRLYHQYECKFYLTVLTDWRYVLPVIFGIVLLSLFMGTIYSRFGKRAGFVFWILWMIVCILGPRVAHSEPEENGLLDQIGRRVAGLMQNIPTYAWIGLGSAAVVAMLGTIIYLSRRQMVR